MEVPEEVPDDVPSTRDVPPSLRVAGSLVACLCHAVGAGSTPLWAPVCPSPPGFPSHGFCLMCYVRTPLCFSEVFHMGFRPLLLTAPGLSTFPKGRLARVSWLPASARSSAVIFMPQWQCSMGMSPWDTLSPVGARARITPSCARGSARLPKGFPSRALTPLVVFARWFLHFIQLLDKIVLGGSPGLPPVLSPVWKQSLLPLCFMIHIIVYSCSSFISV